MQIRFTRTELLGLCCCGGGGIGRVVNGIRRITLYGTRVFGKSHINYLFGSFCIASLPFLLFLCNFCGGGLNFHLFPYLAVGRKMMTLAGNEFPGLVIGIKTVLCDA